MAVAGAIIARLGKSPYGVTHVYTNSVGYQSHATVRLLLLLLSALEVSATQRLSLNLKCGTVNRF